MHTVLTPLRQCRLFLADINPLTPLTVFATFTLASVLACSSTAPPPKTSPPKACKPIPPKLELSASDRLNGTNPSDARPVQVRVYQLKNDAVLQNSSFEEIWQQDRTILADDLLNVVEITVYPGKSKVVELERDEAANKLGVVGLFREPQGKDWFVTYELDTVTPEPPCPKTAPRISVYLDRMQIQDGQGRPSE